MSVDVYMVGLKEPTEEYLDKLKAYRACDNAGVEAPEELYSFFDGDSPWALREDGMECEICEAVEGEVMYDDGAVIDLSKLPKGVTKIRVYCG